jgi:DNA-binding beta-propeller fold protein YncE
MASVSDVTARPHGPVLVAFLACLLWSTSGCGSAGAGEPADAPRPHTAPAGRVVAIGPQPEGVVADPTTHVVAVAVRDPHELVLVDGRSGTVTARTPLPGRLRHLQLAAPGGPVLVPNESTGSLVTVALPEGRVLADTPIGRYAHDATAAADGTIAVADEFGKALVLLRAGQVVHRFTDVTQPGGLAAAGNLVGLVDVGAHELAVYDTTRRVRIGRTSAGEGPTHIVSDRRGRFIVVDTRGQRLLVYGPVPRLRRVATVPLAGTPYGLAYDPNRDRLWVTLTARNQLVRVDLRDPQPRWRATIPTVRQPNTVAVDAATGRLFVTSRTDGVLQFIDP